MDGINTKKKGKEKQPKAFAGANKQKIVGEQFFFLLMISEPKVAERKNETIYQPCSD